MTEWHRDKAAGSYPPDDEGPGFLRTLSDALGSSQAPEASLEGRTHSLACPVELANGKWEQRCIWCKRVVVSGPEILPPGNLLVFRAGLRVNYGPDDRMGVFEDHIDFDSSRLSVTGLPDCEDIE